jgi:hypothetical protein
MLSPVIAKLVDRMASGKSKTRASPAGAGAGGGRHSMEWLEILYEREFGLIARERTRQGATPPLPQAS